MDYVFQFNVVWENIGWLLEGIRVTLIVTFGSLSSGLVFGLLLGMVRLSKRRWLSRLAQAYVELFRNTPALVQLIWVYYCLPILTGINLDAITSCTVALALYGTAYIAEIFRAGIKSIDIGQVEAAQSIGLTYMQAMWSVVLPQAVRRMIPPLVNESITLLKFSSLVSVLGVADLTYQAQVLSTVSFRPIEIFTAIAAIYFVLCGVLAVASQQIERRMAVSDRDAS